MGNQMKYLEKITVFIFFLAAVLTACTDGPRVIMAPGYEPTATDIP